MGREIKLGIFAIMVIAATLFGLTFLKGNNPLASGYEFKTILGDVTQLEASSAVYINGYRVGNVLNIDLNPENVNEMVIEFLIEDDYKIPKDAIVSLKSDGIVGGKILTVSYDKACSGDNCAKDGDVLEGRVVGLLGSMVDAGEVKTYASAIVAELGKAFKDVGSEDSGGALNNTFKSLEASMVNLEKLTKTTDALLRKSAKNLDKTFHNMNSITGNLAESNAQITSMLTNFNSISKDINDAKVGNTITSATEAMQETEKVMTQLQTTLDLTDKVMKNLDVVLLKANDGEGTVAKLLNDKDLYDNLEMTSKNLSFLLQDLRLNPSRYVKVSVFGKKNSKEYVKPEDDPAFKDKK